MRPTSQVLSKASRLPMKPFMGNKDFYKGLYPRHRYAAAFSDNLPTLLGNRAAYLPQGHRTGAPGKHIIGGKGNYRLIDEKVRIFIAPPIEEILNSKVGVPSRLFLFRFSISIEHARPADIRTLNQNSVPTLCSCRRAVGEVAGHPGDIYRWRIHCRTICCAGESTRTRTRVQHIVTSLPRLRYLAPFERNQCSLCPAR
jgi:hypothetical protein